MRERFVLCRVALTAFRLAIGPRSLEDFAVNAAPPTWLAISDRVFFRREPLTAFFSTFKVRHFDDLPVKATPAPLHFTALFRFFELVITLAAVGVTIGRPHYIDVTLEAAVAVTRRRRRVIAAATFRTRQRPPEAMRRIRRTG